MKPDIDDLNDAIQHADVYGDQEWTLADFTVVPLGEQTLARIRQHEDWGGWIDVDPRDYEGLSVEERLAELESFRGAAWVERAREWLKTGVPPIVIIDAPTVVDYQLERQLGDGRGRVNFALAMGLKKLPVVLLKWKHPLAKKPVDNPAPHARFNALARSIGVDVLLVVDEQKALQGRTHARGRELARAFACTDGHTVWVRPKLLTQEPARVDGIFMHELAHCWCIQNGHAEHTERECDDVAKELFGVTLSYDEDDVQTTGEGVRPRPKHLS
jgi:hypothetical protein